MNIYDAILGKMQNDKWQHFCTACMFSVPAHAVFNSALITVAVAFGIGIGKELFDYIDNKFFGASHGVEVLDAVATGAGGVWVALFFSEFTQRVKIPA